MFFLLRIFFPEHKHHKKKKKTKKQKLLERNRRLNNILEQERLQEQNRRKIKEDQEKQRGEKPKLYGGFAKPEKETMNTDQWKEKAFELRSRIGRGRSRAQTLWAGR